jgi:hypothetical protein
MKYAKEDAEWTEELGKLLVKKLSLRVKACYKALYDAKRAIERI